MVAACFAAFPDRGTPLPILNDPRFHRQLDRAAQDEPWFRQPCGTEYRPGPVFVYPHHLAALYAPSAPRQLGLFDRLGGA